MEGSAIGVGDGDVEGRRAGLRRGPGYAAGG